MECADPRSYYSRWILVNTDNCGISGLRHAPLLLRVKFAAKLAHGLSVVNVRNSQWYNWPYCFEWRFRRSWRDELTTQIQHVTHHRFTVDEYYAMADAGILKENASVELIQGEIVEMAPVGNRHASCIDRLVDLLTLLTRDNSRRISCPHK
ncbi:MAG TPA: hypothetical protein DC056_05705 [Dehalococcoidia bacterium]|nr:hypothetical protein [Dehalococcoidia bacterium]